MLEPDTVRIHPGEILLEEFLRPHDLAPSAFAERLGLAPNRITQIVNGDRSITPDTAILLAEAFGTSPQFWLNLQAHYDLSGAIVEVSKDRIERARALRRELHVA